MIKFREKYTILYHEIIFILVPMIAAIGLVDTGTSLFSNSSQLNNDELEAIKDILTDRQSANYKDLENQIIKKLDTVLDTFVPDASDPRLAFIDFDNGFIRPHFSFNLPEDQPLETVERDLEGSELQSPDQEGELVDFSKKIQTLQISNGIEREYGMRVIYKDNDSNQLPSRLYTSKITQAITGSENVDRISVIMDPATGLPRQSPSKYRQQFLVPFGTKEGLYKITTPAGLDTNPWDLENELGSDEMLRRLDVLVSENEFKAQRIEIFPLGLLELLELQEGVIVVEPDQDPDKYTGFFIASNLDPENVYSLYEKPKGPFTNQFTKNVEENGLDSDNIKKPFMDIYYEPISEDQVKVHFGITADPNVTAEDLVDELNGQIDLTDDDNNYIATLDNVELSSARKFEVEVTSDMNPDDIKAALEDGMDEIKLIDNFGKDENGKTTFDFTSERNLNIVPANFPELEDKIDEILGSEDAKIKVPGGGLVPLKPWIGKYSMVVEPEEFLMVLADWEKSVLPIIQSLDIPPGWDIDYKAAISKDESKIELYLSGEASYALSARELMANMAFMSPNFSIADLTLNQPRMFKGTCDAFIQEDGVFETATLKTRIEDFLNGYNQALYPTQIYFNNSEVYKLEDNILRKRRQAEEALDTINKIEFYFKSNEPNRLTPQGLQAAGRKIIADNKSFQSLLVGDSLIITPYMWEEDRIVTTPEPDEDTTTIENTVTTTEPTTTSGQIAVVTDGPKESVAPPTVPPKTTTGHVTTFTSDTDPAPTDENIKDLEEKLDNCNEITNTECNLKEKETFIATQCKYDVTIANDMSSRDRDQIIENCIKQEYTTDPNDVIFNQNVTYMTPNPEGTCADVYENDCDTETSDCQYDEENKEIFCQCKEGFIKEVKLLNFLLVGIESRN